MNDLNPFYREELEKLKKKIIGNCTLCNGTGLYDEQDCKCLKKFFYYADVAVANIPRKYWSATMDDFKGDKLSQETTQKYIDNIHNAQQHGLGLTFLGSYGRGKTFLCILALKAAIKSKYSAYFITMAELIKLIQEGIDNIERATFYKRKVKKTDFLCIDNLGSEYRNLSNFGSFVVAEFDILIRFRTGNLLPTLITTNLTSEKFTEYYGDSVDSLLTASNKKRHVMGIDFRGHLSKKWDETIESSK